MRAEAEAAAKAAPKKEVGPKRGSQVRQSATRAEHQPAGASSEIRQFLYLAPNGSRSPSGTAASPAAYKSMERFAAVDQQTTAAAAGQDPEARELLVQPDRQGCVC